MRTAGGLSRRHKAIAIAAAAAVIAAALALWWLNGARTYDDLELGTTTSAGPDARFVDDDLEGEMARKSLREGAVTTFGVSVLNSGGREVEITGVGPEPTPEDAEVRDYTLTPAGVTMNRTDGPGTAERRIPFRAFSLEPGRQRYFVIALRMPSCDEYEPGSALTIDQFDVRYRSLVFDREQTIPLREPIEIVREPRCA